MFVITDRRVLNQQLQNTVLGFDHKLGQVEVIRDGDQSSKLGDIIRDGNARIVICTLHRFPYIYDKVGSQSGRRYAIIVDEAHSSQSGKNAEKTKAALADTEEALRELAEIEEKEVEQLEKERDAMMERLFADKKLTLVDRRMYGYLDTMRSMRNDESHVTPDASEEEIVASSRIVTTLYLYITAHSITELEMSGKV